MCFRPCNFILELRCLDNASGSVMKPGQRRFKQGVFTPTSELHSTHQMSHTAGTVYTATENALSDCRVRSHQEAQNQPFILYLCKRWKVFKPNFILSNHLFLLFVLYILTQTSLLSTPNIFKTGL